MNREAKMSLLRAFVVKWPVWKSRAPTSCRSSPPSDRIWTWTVRAFVEDIKATGFVAASLTRHGIEGAIVAPAVR